MLKNYVFFPENAYGSELRFIPQGMHLKLVGGFNPSERSSEKY